MIVSVPKALRRLYLIVLFMALSLLFYNTLMLMDRWISPIQEYDIPEGSAVKAFSDFSGEGLDSRAGDRLRFYYWYGE